MGKENWQIRKLSEISYILNGDRSKNYPSRDHYVPKGIPFISAGNIENNNIRDSSLNYITPEKYSQLKSGKLTYEDIIFCLRGSIGKCSIYKFESGAISSSLCIVRVNKKIVENKYIFYFFLSPLASNEIIKYDNGTAQPNLSAKDFGSFVIPFPNLVTQHQIVSKIEELFSELDQGMADLKTAQQQLKIYRQSVLKWAFEGKLTAETARELSVQEGVLPEGWERKTFNDIIAISKEKYKPINSKSLFYVGLEHIEKNTGVLTPECGIEEIKTLKNQFSAGEILYGKLRPNLNKVYLAKENGVCSTDILVLRIKEKCNAQFLTHLMLSNDFVNKMSENTNGVNLPRVSTKFVLEYPVNLPPLQEQHQIVQEIESRLSVADKMEEQINLSLQQAEALRQSILKKAFSGELV